jgi:pimeloyl-ACP methyl ester carboxylesterase
LVLLHGQPGSSDDWQWVVPPLDANYSVVVPDRPGYGRTGGPSSDFAGNVAAVIALLDQLAIDRAVFVGHSWAGAVALLAAATRSERVSGLVLVSSVGPGEHLGWDDRLLAVPVLGEVIAAASIGGLGLVLGRSRIQTLAERRLAGRARDAVVALTKLTTSGSPVWRSFVHEQRALIADLEKLGPALPHISAPVAVVHGRSDRLVPLAVAESNAAAIPGATLELVEGVGHLIPHDRPEKVVAAVDRVVAQTSR